jgi:hypothetical protein
MSFLGVQRARKLLHLEGTDKLEKTRSKRPEVLSNPL